MRQQISHEIVQVATSQTASGTSANTIGSRTARAIEFYINVTDNSGTSRSINFVAQSSIDGTNFAEMARVATVSGNGVQTLVVNRADHALGKSARVIWELDSGRFDFTIDAGRYE